MHMFNLLIIRKSQHQIIFFYKCVIIGTYVNHNINSVSNNIFFPSKMPLVYIHI